MLRGKQRSVKRPASDARAIGRKRRPQMPTTQPFVHFEVPTPDLGERLDPDDLDELPLAEPDLVSKAVAADELCERACRGRVDGSEEGIVYVTMRETDGTLTRAELARELFSRPPYRDMRFLLLVVSRVAAGEVDLAGSDAKEYACRVLLFPVCKVTLSGA